VKFSIFVSCIFAFGSFTASASPLFLGISGQAVNRTQDQLLADIEAKITSPLMKDKSHVKTYYVYKTDHSAAFAVGLITEPLDSSGEAFLANFVANLEQAGFDGLAVSFKPVREIHETVILQAGLHKSDDSFDQNSESRKDFKLFSVDGWESFTDDLGHSFLSENSSDFQTYLLRFFGSEPFGKYVRDVLSKDNEVFAYLYSTLVLENGEKIPPVSPVSPFFNLPFLRNCWAPSYENGMCYPGSAH
jgi:hypothetical protein